MLTEVLVVFVAGVLAGQLLRWRRIRPRLWTATAIAASALLFTMGLSIGLSQGTILPMLPEVALTSLLLGASAAVGGMAVTFLIRGRKRD